MSKQFRKVFNELPEGWRDYGERIANGDVQVWATNDKGNYLLLRVESWEVNQGLAEPEAPESAVTTDAAIQS
jgi:hypothetical protein